MPDGRRGPWERSWIYKAWVVKETVINTVALIGALCLGLGQYDLI